MFDIIIGSVSFVQVAFSSHLLINLVSREKKLLKRICVPTLPKVFGPVTPNTHFFISPMFSALAYMRDEFANNYRDGAVKIGFLVSMSGSSNHILTQAHAKAAVREKIRLIEILVSNGQNDATLKSSLVGLLAGGILSAFKL